ncbi:unnamed protein product, partial [Aphanomyces euteiches]
VKEDVNAERWYVEAKSNDDSGALQLDSKQRKRKELPKHAGKPSSNVKKSRFQEIPTPDKRSAGRKDYVSAYEVGQNKMLDLKREKFEHSKEIRALKLKPAMH